MADIFLSVVTPTYCRSADLHGVLRTVVTGREDHEVQCAIGVSSVYCTINIFKMQQRTAVMSGNVFAQVAPIVGSEAACGIIVLGARHRADIQQRMDEQKIPMIAAGIAIICLLQFYLLGLYSYVSFGDAGEYIVPFVNWVANYYDGGKFAHGLIGGVDAYAVNISGMQHFSLERGMMHYLPTWVAIAFYKSTIYSISFIGTYTLCKDNSASRLEASFLALLYLALLPRGDDTFSQGLHTSLLPMLVYVFTEKINDKRFYFYVTGLALCTSSQPPVHSFLAVPMVVAGWAMLARYAPGRLIAGMAIIGAVEIANWSEVIFASIQLAPFSIRAAGGVTSSSDPASGMAQAIRIWIPGLGTQLFWGISLLLLAAARQPFLRWALFGAGLGLALANLLLFLPWRSIGLDFLGRISWENCLTYGTALGLPVAARACSAWPVLFRGRLSQAMPCGVLIAAAAVGLLVTQRVEMLGTMIHRGGQAQYHTVDNLQNPRWLHGAPVRQISVVGNKVGRNVVDEFYGLESFDGTDNVVPRAISEYYISGLLKVPPTWADHHVYWDTPFFNWETLTLDLDRVAATELLRIANVGYVISSEKLSGQGFTLVFSPSHVHHATSVQNSWQDKLVYYRYRLENAFQADNVFIYALQDPLPRVYAASGVFSLHGDISTKDSIAIIGREAVARKAVIHERYRDAVGGSAGTVLVTAFSLVRDGFDIRVEAPNGGLVVANTPHLPFWSAWSEAGPLTAVPANHIAMTVAVPPGTSTVALRYCRPLLRERLFELLGGGHACVNPLLAGGVRA